MRSTTTKGKAEKKVGRRAQLSARRVPTQDRAQETVKAILEAAADLFGRLGYAQTTTNKVAARAGVSIGSLYQYFPNKDALLSALHEAHQREVHEVVEPALVRMEDPRQELGEGLGQLLQGLVDVHARSPELHRVLGEGGPKGESHGAKTVSRVEAMLRKRPEVRVRNYHLAALLLVQSIESLTRWLVHTAPAELDRQAFVRELQKMLTSYLIHDV